jgi:hypothetical protein
MVPANVALPGSGTPTGVPPNLSVNNASTGEYVTVYQPGVSVNGVPVTLGPGQQQAQAGQNAANASTAQSRFSLGIGNFVGSAAPGGTVPAKGASLAEVASSLGSKPLIQNRKLTNDDVAAIENQSQNTNGRKVITNADLQALTGSTGNVSAGTEGMQQNPVVASERPLDRNDLAQVNSALARSQSEQPAQTQVAQNRADEYSRVVQEAEAGEQQNQPAPNPQARPTEPATPPANAEQGNQPANGHEQLPASGSPLPILALVGLIAIGTGMVYRWKTR